MALPADVLLLLLQVFCLPNLTRCGICQAASLSKAAVPLNVDGATNTNPQRERGSVESQFGRASSVPRLCHPSNQGFVNNRPLAWRFGNVGLARSEVLAGVRVDGLQRE